MKRKFSAHRAAIVFAAFNFFAHPIFAGDFDATTKAVGRTTNGFETPVNQLVTPAGIQVELAGIRPNALALSPDGKILVTAGLTHELVAVEPATGKILQRVPFPSDTAQEEKPIAGGILNLDEKSAVEFHRPRVFAGRLADLSFSSVNGDIKVFSGWPG